MKLAVKLILTVVLGIALVLVVDGYVSLKRQRALFEDDMHHDARQLGLAMKQLVVDAWHKDGRARAWRVIEDANKVEPSIKIRWVWLDAPVGDAHTPRVGRAKLRSLSQGHPVYLTYKPGPGSGRFYSYFSIPVDTQRPGALEISESLASLDAMDRRSLIKTITLTSSLVLCSAGAALLLGIYMVGGPLDEVVGKMRRIGSGDFSGPLQISGHGELDELAAGVNDMCERLTQAWSQVQSETQARIEAVEQLRHEDRLKTVGRLASGIAHELGTPLNVISGYASMISDQRLSGQEVTESARTIKEQSERIAGIIRQLLDFARRRPGQRVAVDLRPLVSQSVALLDPWAQKQDVTLVLQADATTATVRIDVEQIKQVLLNLMTNALQAMSQGGKVEVGLEPAQGPPPAGPADPRRDYVCVWVRDEGEGIDPGNLNRLFEPFFTTKGTGKGTGLGLSIAQGIVHEHGGWIAVESVPGRGSRFSVCLPKEQEPCHDTF